MKALVTGATGLVGNNMVRTLIERGQRVRVLVRNSAARSLEGLGVEIHKGDIRDAAAVAEAARDADLIIHAAARVKIGRTRLEKFRTVNVEGTRNVANTARANGVRLVHVSSTDTVGLKSLDEPADEDTPFDTSICTPYIVTKHEAEQVILQQLRDGLDAVIVNPSFMLGPWDWKPSSGEMLLAVARGLSWLAPRGYFSVIDVRDVCRSIVAAAERGQTGRRYILAGETMSYLEAWRLFADVTGGRWPLFCGGPVIGWIGDIIGLITGNEPAFNSEAVKIANKPRNYSSARAKAELGYTTRPVRETVEDAWRWLQDHGYVTRTNKLAMEPAKDPQPSRPDRPASSESRSPHPE